jgi:hypothetical protein
VTVKSAPSWPEHYAAAVSMGLGTREAYETYDGPWNQARRWSREHRERLERAAADLQSLPRNPTDDGRNP